MYNKILIANRGEIAVRIIRACREMGIRTVAVHSTVDVDSLHVKLADEAICIGPKQSSESYLKIPSIISTAEITGAEAIHPGYGFLSEDGDFAEKCFSSGIDFIGPSAKVIKSMGDKIAGLKLAESAGVPVTPGVHTSIESEEEMMKIAKEIGFPLMIKASAGGGGKGMRVVYSKSSLLKSYQIAKAEAEAAFGNGNVYIEKFIENPRHIEVQILGDKHGNIIHLGERDCSIQRRNQKIIEEAPAPNLSPETREKIHAAAVNLGKHIGYYSAGTIEFLMDSDENFYFMEMNTRLQVEHPVTEFITGLDLVKEQINIAYGNKLKINQEDIQFKGWAIEFRINAENPDNFRPHPGRITAYHQPGGLGVRVDTMAFQEYVVQPYYDSLLAKLICYGKTRQEAIQKAVSALDEYIIEGVDTLIPLHLRIIKSLRYQEGKLTTDFIKNFVNV